MTPFSHKPKNIVVGATGYIGRPLLAQAKANGDAFGTATSDKSTDVPFQLNAVSAFDYGLIKWSDVVFLTAAISAPDVCAREPERAWAVNVTGTSEFIARVMDRGGRVIFFSSDTVYGERADAFDERASCNPAGDYAVMKHEVESRFLGNPLFKTIRLSYVFSREDKFSAYLSACSVSGKEADLFHPFYRAVIHRDDVVDGALALARRWNEFPDPVINFGGPEILSRVDFARVLQKEALPALRFRVTDPGEEFFRNRPRIIQMMSPVFSELLGRPVHTLHEAARIEFKAREIRRD